jgi:hypothetical protein
MEKRINPIKRRIIKKEINKRETFRECKGKGKQDINNARFLQE